MVDILTEKEIQEMQDNPGDLTPLELQLLATAEEYAIRDKEGQFAFNVLHGLFQELEAATTNIRDKSFVIIRKMIREFEELEAKYLAEAYIPLVSKRYVEPEILGEAKEYDAVLEQSVRISRKHNKEIDALDEGEEDGEA